MALYTIFAWTAIVIAGGAYYWIYIRQEPLPVHLLGVSHKPATQSFGVGSGSNIPSQKRKRKSAAVKKRPVTLQTNDLVVGTRSLGADDDSEAEQRPASTQQVQDMSAGLSEDKTLKVDIEPPRKQIKREVHSTPSDADESDALDTPTPAPSSKVSTKEVVEAAATKIKSAAEKRLENITPTTSVDDMIPPEERPAVARVLRISSPSHQDTKPSSRPQQSQSERTSGPALDSDGLTKKQRQNLKKKERHREARAREEAIRQSQLRAHQKELETIRLNSQIKAAEKKSNQPNPWQQTGRHTMEDSVYTVRNLSEENLTTVGHPSDGAGSEEGWQEVTSRAAKKAGLFKPGTDKSGSGTEGSEVSSSIDESEEGLESKVSPPYTSSNAFANLDS